MARILVDLDSTCADLFASWLGWLKIMHGDELELLDVTTWDMHVLAKKAGKRAYEAFAQPGFFRNLPLIPGAAQGVKSFVDAGHEVFVVTAAEYPQSFGEKVEWVREHLPFLTKRQLFFGHEKHLLPADAIVDDAPHVAEAYRKAHPNALVAGIRYPYNTECEAFDFLVGFNNWEVLANTILKRLAAR